MPIIWTLNCFLGCIYVVYYNVYIVFLVLNWLSNLEFWRPKKVVQVVKLGEGGEVIWTESKRTAVFFVRTSLTTANVRVPWNHRGLSESDGQHMYLQQHKQCSLLIPPYHQSSCTHIHLLMCALVCNSCHKLMHLVVTATSQYVYLHVFVFLYLPL